MKKGKILITDYGFPGIEQETKMLSEAGYEVHGAKCTTEEEVIRHAENADALLVQWAPVTGKVMASLEKCRVIVRYGIGTDNIDLEAARQKGIPVCNVPDYCIQEVADHTVALTLAVGRQIMETGVRMKEGIWKITPPRPMPAFSDMLAATVGFGRIAREVLKRMKPFGFRTAAFDPNVSADEMLRAGVEAMPLEQLLAEADIISLHLPLNAATKHIINERTISRMKRNAIIINTSRGGLIDTPALIKALQEEKVVAGLDVFEEEPLPPQHPLWKCKQAVLTSHTAWYSERSVPQLQRMAALETLRALRGEALKNRVV